MKKLILPLLLVALCLAAFLLWPQDSSQKPLQKNQGIAPTKTEKSPVPDLKPFVPKPHTYQEADATIDGIGKIYHGREISHVMGHLGIDWLERDTRIFEEAPQKAVAALKLAPDTVIADIGAGSGYYSFRLAPLIPQGKVIAIDIQPEMIDFLEKKKNDTATKNLETHLGKIDNLDLPANSLDAALIVDAYHEFSHPSEMMQSLHHALRPGGVLYLLEYRAEDPKVPIKPLHKMSEKQAILELKAEGFKHLRTEESLPWQHLLIFQK